MNGQAQVNMPDGEVLNGEYAFLLRGKPGYGDLYSRSYGYTGAGDPNTLTYGQGGGFGEISLHGNKGTSLRCDFYYDKRGNTPIGTGWGVCKFSNGQINRMEIK